MAADPDTGHTITASFGPAGWHVTYTDGDNHYQAFSVAPNGTWAEHREGGLGYTVDHAKAFIRANQDAMATEADEHHHNCAASRLTTEEQA